ncbi:GMC family oxidoreductase [Kitasatospora camelliae]|uniref:GMC family oxidoreductase n=1 Tax=Kitasatospora camelliae TaxID=3156397 RepID=A0AAU8K564_9ACTN
MRRSPSPRRRTPGACCGAPSAATRRAPAGRATAAGPGRRLAPAPGEGGEGRPCQGHASCVPICPSQAKYTPLRTQARWGPSVRLVTRAVVTRVLIDPAGRATGVRYRRYAEGPEAAPDPAEYTAGAELVVLAAHAIETARLLLVSGAAGGSGQVGRNLMDHPVLLTWGLMPRPVGPYRGPGSTAGLEAFRFGAARARRAPFRVEFGNWGWTWPLGPPDGRVAELLRTGGPDGRGLFGPGLRAAVGDRIGREFSLQFELEQDADPSNRVTLDPSRRDRFGTPRPVLHYDLSDWVRRGAAAARSVSEQVFALLGAEDHTRFDPGPAWPGYFAFEGRGYAYRAAGHGAGTHLMGASPATSVVDPWQRCWDHPNLYAVGCGSMPSISTANPSLTMAALALRSCDRIHRDLLALHRPAAVRDAVPAVPGRPARTEGAERP